MIGKDIKAVDCVGKYATLDYDIQNHGGRCIAAGSKVKIVGFGRAFTIHSETCPHCGQSTYISGVKKNQLTLCDNGDGGNNV